MQFHPAQRTVWLNGRFLPESEAVISVTDRGFLYGDGLFETISLHGGRPFLWKEHGERFARSAEFIQIPVPLELDQLHDVVRQVCASNHGEEGLIRIALSRGSGQRGYSIRGAGPPTLLISYHPDTRETMSRLKSWSLAVSTHRLPVGTAINQCKSSSKMLQIMARMEAEAKSSSDALILNTEGRIAECASANLFLIRHGTIVTPPLAEGCLDGVTRNWVLRKCSALQVKSEEAPLILSDLLDGEGCFATLTGSGIVEITEINRIPIRTSPITRQLHTAYWNSVEQLSGQA